MLKSVDFIMQQMCRGLGLQPLAFGSEDSQGFQIETLIVEHARMLRATRIFPTQKKTYSFDTEANREEYPLPADFFAPLPDTHYNQIESTLLPHITDSAWNYYLYGLGGDPADRVYRIFGPDANPNTGGGQFKILPINPDASETISFEYVTSNLFIPKFWLPSTAYTSGTYVSANGNIYLCDTNGTSGSTPPSGTTANISDGSTQWDYYDLEADEPWDYPINSTNVCLFDADLMILGTRYRYLQAKGLEYEPVKADHDRMLDSLVARYRGSQKGNFCLSPKGPRYTVPDGGWSL
jgi:hypothetical protein